MSDLKLLDRLLAKPQWEMDESCWTRLTHLLVKYRGVEKPTPRGDESNRLGIANGFQFPRM